MVEVRLLVRCAEHEESVETLGSLPLRFQPEGEDPGQFMLETADLVCPGGGEGCKYQFLLLTRDNSPSEREVP